MPVRRTNHSRFGDRKETGALYPDETVRRLLSFMVDQAVRLMGAMRTPRSGDIATASGIRRLKRRNVIYL